MASSSPSPTEPGRPASVRRRRPGVSLGVLAGVCVAFAVLFLQVVRPLALPLFLAAVFALLAFPLHEWLTARWGGSGGLSALVIVSSLILLLLGPTTAGFVASYGRISDAIARLERPIRMPDEVENLLDQIAGLLQSDSNELRRRAVQAVRDGEQLLFGRAVQAVSGVVSFGLGLLLFAVSGFFFLKDGRSIVRTWEELTPLPLEQDRQVRRQFAVVCRGVVLSTLMASLAQAVTFGIGIVLLDVVFGLGLGTWSVLLILLMAVFAMVPIVGSTAVWVPLSFWLIIQREYAAGVILMLHCSVIVANADHLARMLVLKGTAGMHPLMALVSVLGGVHQMGVLGVFVGPVVAGVLITLLRILKQQLDQFEAPPPRRAPAHEETAAAITVHGDPSS